MVSWKRGEVDGREEHAAVVNDCDCLVAKRPGDRQWRWKVTDMEGNLIDEGNQPTCGGAKTRAEQTALRKDLPS